MCARPRVCSTAHMQALTAASICVSQYLRPTVEAAAMDLIRAPGISPCASSPHLSMLLPLPAQSPGPPL